MQYDDIVDIAKAYADIESADLDKRMDHFLRIVESRVNRKLKTREMSIRSVHKMTGQEYVGLPDEYAGMREVSFYVDGVNERTTIDRETPTRMNDMTGRNKYVYTIIASQLQVKPFLTNAFLEIEYYRRVPALTQSNNLNWLSESYPDLYINGLLVEISSYTKDSEAVNLWNARFQEVRDEIIENDAIEQSSGTPMFIRVG